MVVGWYSNQESVPFTYIREGLRVFSQVGPGLCLFLFKIPPHFETISVLKLTVSFSTCVIKREYHGHFSFIFPLSGGAEFDPWL